MKRRWLAGPLLAISWLAVCPASASAPREPLALQEFGPGSYYVHAISRDGRVVAGAVWPQFSNLRYVRWIDGVAQTFATAPEGDGYYAIHAMTPDGAAVVGRIIAGSAPHGYRWRDGVLEQLGALPASDYFYSEAWDVSLDGRRVVGWSYVSGPRLPVQWLDGVVEGLPLPSDQAHGEARLIADDGSRVVGIGNNATGTRLLVWENGSVRDAGDPPGGAVRVDPRAMTPDGSVVVGQADFANGARAFLWDGEAFASLGELPGGDLGSIAIGVSDGADVVIGSATTNAGAACPSNCSSWPTPFIWTPETGMRRVEEYLGYACGYDLHHWSVSRWSPTGALSEDGRFLAFVGTDSNGRTRVFVAEIGDFCDPGYAVPENPIEPGDYIVASGIGNALLRVDRETHEQIHLSQGGILGGPFYVLQGPGDEVFLAHPSGRIAAVDVHGGAQRNVGSLESNPATLAIDPNGWLYAAETSRATYPRVTRIVRIDPASGAKTPVAQGPWLGSGGGALVADRSGKLFYRGEDAGQPAIIRIDPATGEAVPVAIGDLGDHNNLTVTRDGRLVTIDFTGIRTIDLATGARRRIVADIGAAGIPFLMGRNTSIDSLGRLLVPDNNINRFSAADLDTGAIEGLTVSEFLEGPTHAIELLADCDDGFDNDGDAAFDYPNDPGCRDANDDVETHIDVAIDIRPGSANNVITNLPQGLIPVAILGSADFDVRSLDVESVRFGPGGAAPAFGASGFRTDVDRDGYTDWTLWFRTTESAIPMGAQEACLTGETDGGVPIHGCDGVVSVPLCNLGFEGAFLFLPFVLWQRRRGQAQ